MSVPAAQYLRMSTEHQQYSLINQAAAIASYAIANDLQIVKTYTDEGRSGLVLKERSGLQQLLRDVVAPDLQFKVILVYDVSRWGRFQDTDEAAHYEFICKSAGAPVRYCAETFPNDNTLPSLIMKNLKRAMAGEYSRELSVKVYEGLKRIVQLGFSTGGVPGYGFRRMLVGHDGTHKMVLAHGERKMLQTEHVKLVHGPAEEVATVREIYRLAIEEKLGPSRIATLLNQRGIPYWNDRAWYAQTVSRILTHPKYIGCQVFGRKSERLHAGTTYYPRSNWLVVPNSHESIVSSETFDQAQHALRSVTLHKSNDTLLHELRNYFAGRTDGRLSLVSVNQAPSLPSIGTYIRRFGGTKQLCEQLGIDLSRELHKAECRNKRLAIRRELMGQLHAADPERVTLHPDSQRRKGFLRVKKSGTVAVVGCPFFTTLHGEPRWLVCPAETDRVRNRIFLLCFFDQANERYERMYIMKTLRSRTQFTVRPKDEYLSSGIVVKAVSDLYDAVRLLRSPKLNVER